MKGAVLRSGEVVIDPICRTLTRDGKLIQPPRKALDLILLLIRRRGAVVMRESIEREIWPEVRVSKASLRWLLKEVRRHLGDNGTDQRYIETTRGYGLRWIADVEVFDVESGSCVPHPLGYGASSLGELANAADGDLETGVCCAELIRIAESQLRAGKFDEAREALRRAASMTERISDAEDSLRSGSQRFPPSGPGTFGRTPFDGNSD